jgi:hypothetical protein
MCGVGDSDSETVQPEDGHNNHIKVQGVIGITMVCAARFDYQQ